MAPPAGTEVARVFWGEHDGEPGLMVHASDPGDLAVAAIVLCKAITDMPDFPPEMKAAAQALIGQLTGGRSFLKEKPFHLFRGVKGQG